MKFELNKEYLFNNIGNTPTNLWYVRKGCNNKNTIDFEIISVINFNNHIFKLIDKEEALLFLYQKELDITILIGYKVRDSFAEKVLKPKPVNYNSYWADLNAQYLSNKN